MRLEIYKTSIGLEQKRKAKTSIVLDSSSFLLCTWHVMYKICLMFIMREVDTKFKHDLVMLKFNTRGFISFIIAF